MEHDSGVKTLEIWKNLTKAFWNERIFTEFGLIDFERSDFGTINDDIETFVILHKLRSDLSVGRFFMESWLNLLDKVIENLDCIIWLLEITQHNQVFRDVVNQNS